MGARGQVGMSRLLCECPRAWQFGCWQIAMDAVCKMLQNNKVRRESAPRHPALPVPSCCVAVTWWRAWAWAELRDQHERGGR